MFRYDYLNLPYTFNSWSKRDKHEWLMEKLEAGLIDSEDYEELMGNNEPDEPYYNFI